MKVFPIDFGTPQKDLYENIINVLVNYRADRKCSDIITRYYAIDIMKLFDKFIEDSKKGSI
jgi:hypothetical protein